MSFNLDFDVINNDDSTTTKKDVEENPNLKEIEKDKELTKNTKSDTDKEKDQSDYQGQTYDELPDEAKQQKESVNIQHITNYSYKRANLIAKIARSDHVFIAYYKDEPEIPTPGKKYNPKELFEYRKFFFNHIRTDKGDELLEMNNDITKLREIANQKNGYTDQEGNFHPPKYRDNDPNVTGLTDQEFFTINHLVVTREKEFWDEMGKWYLGINDKVKKNMERESYRTALEACKYKLENGDVEDDPNLIYS